MADAENSGLTFGRPPSRSGARSRHGRGMRSAVTGPLLPILYSRIENFYTVVAQTVQYLRSMWPNELADVHIEIASNPAHSSPSSEVNRWFVDAANQRITLYRIPIQRLGRLHRNDDLHRQMAIEAAVIHAVAEYLGKEPWELGPEGLGRGH